MDSPHLDICEEYKVVSGVAGTQAIFNKVKGPKYQEIFNIRLGDGSMRRGQVLEVDGERIVVQVLNFLKLQPKLNLRKKPHLNHHQLDPREKQRGYRRLGGNNN